MLLPGDWPKLAAASVAEAPFWPGQAIHAVYARVAPICEKDQRRQPFPLPGIGFPIRGHHPDVTPLPSKVWMACPGSWQSPPSLTGVCTCWERQPRSSRQDTHDCKTAYMCSRWCPLHWHPQRSAAHTRHTHCPRGAWWACPTRCRTGREEEEEKTEKTWKSTKVGRYQRGLGSSAENVTRQVEDPKLENISLTIILISVGQMGTRPEMGWEVRSDRTWRLVWSSSRQGDRQGEGFRAADREWRQLSHSVAILWFPQMGNISSPRRTPVKHLVQWWLGDKDIFRHLWQQ